MKYLLLIIGIIFIPVVVFTIVFVTLEHGFGWKDQEALSDIARKAGDYGQLAFVAMWLYHYIMQQKKKEAQPSLEA